MKFKSIIIHMLPFLPLILVVTSGYFISSDIMQIVFNVVMICISFLLVVIYKKDKSRKIE